jgi:gliding motility-associated-like protein
MMNKYHLHLFLCSCLLFSVTATYAQSWKWEVQAQASTPPPVAEENTDHPGAVDSKGNLCITGYKYASGPSTLTFGTTNITGTSEAFIVKYDSNGNVLWARQSVSSPNSTVYGASVSTDRNDNVFATGVYQLSTSFGPYAFSMGTSCSDEMFLVKYDPNGNLQWATSAKAPDTNNTANHSAPHSIFTDKWGYTYVTGFFSDTVLFDSHTLIATQSSGASVAAFLVKYNENGQCVWARQSTSPGNISSPSNSVTVDDSGNVYITGYFQDTIVFGSYTLTSNNQGTLFLVKYDSAGNVKWAQQGHGPIIGNCVAADYKGGVYVTGKFNTLASLNNDTVRSTALMALYLAKYNTHGNLLWLEQNSPQDTVRWQGISLACDSLRYGGGYLIANPPLFSPFHNSTSLNFGGKFMHKYLAASTSPDVLFQFDSSGHTTCFSIFTEGFEDDGTSVAVSHSSKFIYATGDLSGSSIFDNDTIGNAGDVSFSARWQQCCGIIKDSMVVTMDTCGKLGQAIAYSQGTYMPFTYYWQPTAVTDSAASSLQPGSYKVTITDGKGCTKTDSAAITSVNIPITVQACCDTTITAGNSVTLVTSLANKYAWSPNTSLSCDTCQNTLAHPSVTTLYHIIVTNIHGCTATDSVLITVKDKLCGTIFVPNAFSPNGDNVDDIEYVYGGCIEALDFKIFDRWGNMVFETTDPAKGWDGNFNSKPMSTGVYDYTLVAVQSSGKSTDQKGNITLVR